MRALLDVNLLIALFDADHVFHNRAHDWWNEHASEGWASCPLTENGFIRIMSNPAYSKKLRLAPSDLTARLARFVVQTDHEFWPDDLTIRDQQVFAVERLHRSKQITDAYLLGLANRHGGQFATFDRELDISIVPQAKGAALCIVP